MVIQVESGYVILFTDYQEVKTRKVYKKKCLKCGIFSLCAPPPPPVRNAPPPPPPPVTEHVRLGVANNSHPLSCGGGGANGKDPKCVYGPKNGSFPL